MDKQSTPVLTWRFPRFFWIANGVELFERAAYYGMFIALTLYLTREVGFSDIETGWISAFFAALIYLAPTFTGALADRIGFRRALIAAFTLLTGGYFLLGLLQIKATAILALFLILLGGSFVKPVITGTVAKASDGLNRARAYSLFYQVVNIGAFLGKTAAKPLRTELGLKYINFYSASMALIALLLVLLFYRNVDAVQKRTNLRETWQGFLQVLSNTRFMLLILITAGFWLIQGQLYASMPKYALRMIGEHAAPEWLANINPLMVVLFVVPITHLVRRIRPVSSIAIALLLIPFSALMISASPLLESIFGTAVPIGAIALHPITLMLGLGIALQGLAECFLSPRYLEFASKQAPDGKEGLYMGFSHLNIFFAWLIGFIASGYLLNAFCPEPTLLPLAVQKQYQAALAGQAPMPEVYAHAHYIWYVFAGVGVLAFASLFLFRWITDRIDRRKAQEEGDAGQL
ncbi:MFS transporter [candidate division KSB1 bacterium]|nr:MFS transporter [candidate division KSB1 bacterium]